MLCIKRFFNNAHEEFLQYIVSGARSNFLFGAPIHRLEPHMKQTISRISIQYIVIYYGDVLRSEYKSAYTRWA